MIYRILILFSLLFSNVYHAYCQSRTISKISFDSLYVNNKLNWFATLEIANMTTSDLILWIDTTNKTKSNSQKIKQYFLLIKGDYSLSQMSYEDMNIKTPYLFLDFIKIMHKGEKFYVQIVLNSSPSSELKDKLCSFFNQSVVSIPKSELCNKVNYENLIRMAYKSPVITLIGYELLKW